MTLNEGHAGMLLQASGFAAFEACEGKQKSGFDACQCLLKIALVKRRPYLLFPYSERNSLITSTLEAHYRKR